MVDPKSDCAAALSFALLLFVGIQAFYKLPITRFPNIERSCCLDQRRAERRASPAELEMQVTKEVEDAVASISGIDEVSVDRHRWPVRQGGRPSSISRPPSRSGHRTRSARSAAIFRRHQVPVVSKVDVEDRRSDIRRLLSQHDARGAVLVRRRHHQAGAAGQPGIPSVSTATAVPTAELRIARSGQARCLRHHRRRREPAAARNQRQPRLRRRPDRRQRASSVRQGHARRLAAPAPPPSACPTAAS